MVAQWQLAQVQQTLPAWGEPSGTGVDPGLPGNDSHAMPLPSLSSPWLSEPGPPAFSKNRCASSQRSKSEQSRSVCSPSIAASAEDVGVGEKAGTEEGTVGDLTGADVGAEGVSLATPASDVCKIEACSQVSSISRSASTSAWVAVKLHSLLTAIQSTAYWHQ